MIGPWQTMETAPRTEEPILAYSPTGGFYGGGKWAVVYRCRDADIWHTWPDWEYEFEGYALDAIAGGAAMIGLAIIAGLLIFCSRARRRI